MPHIHVKNPTVRDQRGTTGPNSFSNFSITPSKPTDTGVKVGKAGRKLIASDNRADENATSRKKYRDNYDRIFGKK